MLTALALLLECPRHQAAQQSAPPVARVGPHHGDARGRHRRTVDAQVEGVRAQGRGQAPTHKRAGGPLGLDRIGARRIRGVVGEDVGDGAVEVRQLRRSHGSDLDVHRLGQAFSGRSNTSRIARRPPTPGGQPP